MIEVEFINGVSEFLVYQSKTIKVTLNEPNEIFEYTIDTNTSNIVEDSLELISNNLEEGNELNLTVNKELITITSLLDISKLNIELNFVFINTNPDDLFSVDYENGYLYLSKESIRDLNINYKYDSMFIEAKKSLQLQENEDYKNSINSVSINNYKDNSTITCIYENKYVIDKFESPEFNNLKLNLILKNGVSI